MFFIWLQFQYLTLYPLKHLDLFGFIQMKVYFCKVWNDVDTDTDINIKGRDDVTLHCTELGNYEKLQCDNGLCWCVEERYGFKIFIGNTIGKIVLSEFF